MLSLANPRIDGRTTSVPTLLNALPRSATKVNVGGRIPIPPFDGLEYHYQGIAPYNGTGLTVANGVICASSTVGYFSGFSQARGHSPSVKSVIVPQSTYFHTGGLQMLGDLLPVALESKDEQLKGLVSFYDVGNLSGPVFKYSFLTPSRKASASAITTYSDAAGVLQAMLMIYEYDNQQMYIYRAPVSSIGGTSSPWELQRTYTGSAFDTGDQYQGFALITQDNARGSTVYLLGFREDEELWLWTVNTTAGTSYGEPTLVTHYTGWNGSDWANGVGVQIAGPTTLRVFGTARDPSGSSTYPGGPANYNFDVFVYGTT